MRHPKILTTLKTYSWRYFAADLFAGATVAMVALPLSIAIAIASGASPSQGIITAIIGGFLISLTGGSRVQIGGPTGAFIVVVFSIITNHGYDGLVIATFMAGLILITAGYFRIGRLIAYIPEAVINGFTIGIAVIIAFSQFKDFFGLSIDHIPVDFLENVSIVWNARQSVNIQALFVALVTLALIITFRRIAPKLPGLIVAVAIGSYLIIALDLSVDTIASKFGELPNQLPTPQFPSFSMAKVLELLPSAFVIAFLAAVESLLSAMVADRMTDGQHRPNAEVLAQGFGNIASSLFGGLPVTGAIARTATNIRAGGKTPVAGIVHALVILVTLMIAAPLAGYLAMPSLAALLILTAWNMSEPQKWPSYLKTPTSERILLITTILLTVFVGLPIAIGVGVSIGLALKLQNRTPPTRL